LTIASFSNWLGPKKKKCPFEDEKSGEISKLQGGFHPLEKRFGLLGRLTTGIYFVWVTFLYRIQTMGIIATIFVSRKIWGMCFLSNQQTEKSKLLVYVYLLSLI